MHCSAVRPTTRCVFEEIGSASDCLFVMTIKGRASLNSSSSSSNNNDKDLCLLKRESGENSGCLHIKSGLIKIQLLHWVCCQAQLEQSSALVAFISDGTLAGVAVVRYQDWLQVLDLAEHVLCMQVLSAVDQDQIMDKREFTKFEL